MPSINILENLNGLTNNLQQIRQQTREAEAESLRIEGMIRVFKNLQDVGVVEIPIPAQTQTKPLEPMVEEQVLDDEAAVQEAESKQE
jgi:hypothetical protein